MILANNHAIFTRVTPDRRLQVSLHAGQTRMMQSRARVVLVLAGTQSGKTSSGPIWLLQEIKAKGPGDYLVATPTFPLLELKLMPEFKRLFETQLELGRYVSSPIRRFTFSKAGAERLFGFYDPEVPTQIYFGHAQDPDSLESATAKAAWLDEAGQKKFKLGSFQAIQRRLSIHQGRTLITTTPYALGWLKDQVHDLALREVGKKFPEAELINFRSVDNPAFARSEYERAKLFLPDWKHKMMYDGIFTRPAGQIYDCFNLDDHKIKPFAIPDHWPRFIGLDFGGVNTAAVFIAMNPQSRELFLYREYLAGNRTAAEHVQHLRAGEPGDLKAFGGAKSEGNWRLEFKSGGLSVSVPLVAEVEVGILRVYGLFKSIRLKIFDSCVNTLDQTQSYSRVLDSNDEPTQEIEDKATFHYLDALRYVAGYLSQPAPKPQGAVGGSFETM